MGRDQRMTMSADALQNHRAMLVRRGREVYERAIRTGENVLACTEQELARLGETQLRLDQLERESDPAWQAARAGRIFWNDRTESKRANVIDADKYFHCRANCNATRVGPFGALAAPALSWVREEFDPKNHRSPIGAIDRAADEAANRFGQSVGADSRSPLCSQACRPLRPSALPKTY
jgi:hypothetical protein